MTTDQVRELEKAKKAIENVLQQAEQQETDQTGKNLSKSARASRCTDSSAALFLREISQQRKAAVQEVLEQQLLPISERIHMLEKARACQNKQSTIHKTTQQHPYGMAYYKPK